MGLSDGAFEPLIAKIKFDIDPPEIGHLLGCIENLKLLCCH
jgi:hypothetical protein